MFVRLTSLAAAVVLAVPAFGQDVAAKKTDPAAATLARLREPWKPIDPAEAPLGEFAAVLREKLDLNVVWNEEVFKAYGIDPVATRILKLPRGKGLSLRTVLNASLAPSGVTFLVRKDHVEFTPVPAAAKQLKVPLVGDEGVPQLAETLVSVVAKERPLNDLVAELAEDFDLNVVVAPQAGDSRMAFVTARLLNVPAAKALDTIAATADLRVVRTGNVFLVTSQEHAVSMFNEKLEREKQKIEVELLRKGGPPVPPGIGGIGGGAIPPPEEKPVEKK
jgi:hypothetical protein